MPGLGDSNWDSKPANDASAQQARIDNGSRVATDRHVSVPSFGYFAPSASTSRPTTARPATKPPVRAEVAGKAAAKRMDELQGGSNTFSKHILYQKYGRPNPPRDHPSAAPVTPSSRDAHSTTETDDGKQTRLHKLFNKYFPPGDELYNIYPTLGFSNEEVKAIQEDIVEYRVKTALAARKRETYTAPWETPKPGVTSQKQGTGNAMDLDSDDPFGLGLASSPVSKGSRGLRWRTNGQFGRLDCCGLIWNAG
ncbi:hypothetical protein BU25DRAFT_475062 [Macroventuria anomochaeta]|uniref:Uncharacterized protein n=1 Tax=Macroventuria anomochaeta TaxID=301207 RepID=A0ACB6SCH6_9PLEO|nr:uncharacterized protein BU25DRAFT_475062 [Macroventuria anomochaeta]KAF2631985.1 hypothetical protein BU25DRAFT_475062 [Macroventuria anomochaeta]